MKKAICFLSILGFLQATAQDTPAEPKRQPGQYDTNKFSQMYDLMATPNMFRTASGAPGPAYYQQQADYKMNIELDDKNTKLYGTETITYHNNAPEGLEYLWLQLDQNQKDRASKSPLVDSQKM
ncbi:MAG: M1 family peptidase, partial [Flavobacterium sp.]